MENYNFIATEADNLIYLPNSDGTETTGLAQVKFDAMGGTAPLWKDVRYNLSLQDVTSSDNPIVDFNMLVGLYGVTDVGNVELVGEEVISTPSTTLTSSLHVFDLLTSACHSKFFTTNDTGTADKITLKLPFRSDYIEDMTLHVGTYDGWKRCKLIPVVGTATYSGTYIPIRITIPYDSDMNADFSDLRFTDWDGTPLNYYVWTKTNSTSATVYVQLVSTPLQGVTKYINVWYKNSTATSISDHTAVFTYYDAFEDNLVNGRAPPYTSLYQNGGTLSITNTTPISGAYSLKHVGGGAADNMGWAYSGKTFPLICSLEFDVKLITQGEGANTPYISLLYFQYSGYQNWGRVVTWYDGTYQKVGLQKNVSGTISNYGTQTIQTGKWAVGGVKHIRISRNNAKWAIQIDNGNILNATGDPGQTAVFGGGAQRDSVALWDNIMEYPNLYTLPTTGNLSTEKQDAYGGTWTWQSILSDSLVAGATNALFTTPTMDINAPAYITYKEYGNTILTGNKFRINNGGVIKQGYNGLDAYKSLILRFEVDTNSNYTVKVNSAEANYEV